VPHRAATLVVATRHTFPEGGFDCLDGVRVPDALFRQARAISDTGGYLVLVELPLGPEGFLKPLPARPEALVAGPELACADPGQPVADQPALRKRERGPGECDEKQTASQDARGRAAR